MHQQGLFRTVSKHTCLIHLSSFPYSVYSRFDPQYSQPDYWLQQAQHYAEQAARATMGAADDTVDGGAPEAPAVHAAVEEGVAPDSLEARIAALGNLGEFQADVQEEQGEAKKGGTEGGKKAGSDEEGPKVDLDTRLKMLMKGPQTSMPAFLLQELNNSESEEEKAEDDVAKELEEANAAGAKSMFPLLPDEVPLSRPPSPFLTAAHYLSCHKESVEERRRARIRGSRRGRGGEGRAGAQAQ